jgi:hypothetical protein
MLAGPCPARSTRWARNLLAAEGKVVDPKLDIRAARWMPNPPCSRSSNIPPALTPPFVTKADGVVGGHFPVLREVVEGG